MGGWVDDGVGAWVGTGARRARHARGPLRIAAQTKCGRQGQLIADPRSWRHARPDRQVAVRVSILHPSLEFRRVKRIAILGSTGSIGRSALAVIEAHPARLRVVALAAGENASLLAEQIARHEPLAVGVASATARDELTRRLQRLPRPAISSGPESLLAVATHPDADLVLCASSGTAALEAVLAPIQAGKTVALANKENIAMAGA